MAREGGFRWLLSLTFAEGKRGGTETRVDSTASAILDIWRIAMTQLLEIALDSVRKLSPDEQDQIARAMLSLAGAQTSPTEDIDPADLFHVIEGLEQARRREFSSVEDVAAAFGRFQP